MMNVVEEKFNFPRFWSEILNGTVTLSQCSQIFAIVLEFLDDYYFSFSGKVFKKISKKNN